MSKLYTSLFWFVTMTSLLSGFFGFLCKIPFLYYPQVYLIGDIANQRPGNGSTPFERLATFVFGLIYVLPMLGMFYAHFHKGSTAITKRAALIMPWAYHIASTYGIFFVFPDALNQDFTSLGNAAMQHAFYAVLFSILFMACEDSKMTAMKEK